MLAVVVVMVIAVASTSRCGGQSPANPSGASPQVTGISPAQVLRQDAVQSVTVNGHNFISGLTVELTDPNGGSKLIERNDIQALQPTSFQMLATLSLAGPYSIRIKNPGGDQSEPFTFVVQAEVGGTPPHIDSLSPTSVVHSANAQIIAVAGSNFSSAINVTLIDPSGQALGVNGAIVGVVLPNTFQIGVTLSQIGTYTLFVTNPTGEVSNSVAITVF